MNILDFARQIGIDPKRLASTHGGEYKSKCPRCQGGQDRFCIWPERGETGGYWCRVCESEGDGIQFCRDFLGMGFKQACEAFRVTRANNSPAARSRKRSPFVELPPIVPMSELWQLRAGHFIDYSNEKLMQTPAVIDLLLKRGINMETIKHFAIGWSASHFFRSREDWGLATELKEDGTPKRLWLPKGIVIPTFEGNRPIKIKVRRDEWTDGDKLPKYVEIPGSKRCPSVYGDRSKPVIVVESELDAILIQQHVSDLVCCVALGGVSKKPDRDTHSWLQRARLILLSFDFDEPGKLGMLRWFKAYPNARVWPSPDNKSPGDAHQNTGLDIREWVISGLKCTGTMEGSI